MDADFGPFFLKFSTYFPFTAKLCINGNEWAKRQAAKAGISFEALDNGFAACADVPALQAVCDSLGPAHIEALRCVYERFPLIGGRSLPVVTKAGAFGDAHTLRRCLERLKKCPPVG